MTNSYLNYRTTTNEIEEYIKKWKDSEVSKDLLEPQEYPDPSGVRESLGQQLNKDEDDFKKITNKATLRALAPYLQIIHKDQKKKIESAISQKVKVAKLPLFKKSKEQVFSVRADYDILHKSELIESIHETGNILKVLVNATDVYLYLIEPVKREVFRSSIRDSSTFVKKGWKIEEKKIMAAYAAHEKRHVISNNVQTDRRFPEGLGRQDHLMKFALCVPVKTPDGQVIAVYELVRNAFGPSFNKMDLQLVLTVTNWVGVAVLQNSLYSSVLRRHELTDYLQQLTVHYHCKRSSLHNMISDFLVFARETIVAEHCRFYVVVKESERVLFVEEFDHSEENPRILFKRHSKKEVESNPYLRNVIIEKKTINGPNKGDKFTTGSSDKSVLCTPVVCSCNFVIGAIELTNKRVEDTFTKEDEETLKTFSMFVAINLHHMHTSDSVVQTEHHNNVFHDMLIYHIKPCAHNQESLKKMSGGMPDDFFTFSWYPLTDDMPRLVELTINMFHEVLGDSFMNLNNLPKFILTVQNCYRPNPYHNFQHAFSVAHTMANIVSRYYHIFNGIERKGLMVAALCHDVDHRGYTNNFIQLTKHYLSSLYDSSPLENHHFAVAKMIISQCSMFSYLKPEIYNHLLSEIYKYIIATDLSLYFQCRMELMKVADAKTFTFKDSNHRHLVKGLMMTACDLSGQTKPLAICKKVTEDVYEEFFQQGDIEKKMGFVPLPTMDRDKKDMISENQVHFLSVVVLPCVETVSRIFSSLSPMVEDTKLLLQQWKDLVKMKEEENLKAELAPSSGAESKEY